MLTLIRLLIHKQTFGWNPTKYRRLVFLTKCEKVETLYEAVCEWFRPHPVHIQRRPSKVQFKGTAWQEAWTQEDRQASGPGFLSTLINILKAEFLTGPPCLHNHSKHAKQDSSLFGHTHTPAYTENIPEIFLSKNHWFRKQECSVFNVTTLHGIKLQLFSTTLQRRKKTTILNPDNNICYSCNRANTGPTLYYWLAAMSHLTVSIKSEHMPVADPTVPTHNENNHLPVSSRAITSPQLLSTTPVVARNTSSAEINIRPLPFLPHSPFSWTYVSCEQQKTLTKRAAAPTCGVQSLFYEWRQAQSIHISPLSSGEGEWATEGQRTPRAPTSAAAGGQTRGKVPSRVAGSHGETEPSGVCVPREDLGERERGRDAERTEGRSGEGGKDAVLPDGKLRLPPRGPSLLSLCLFLSLPVCTLYSLFTTWACFVFFFLLHPSSFHVLFAPVCFTLLLHLMNAHHMLTNTHSPIHHSTGIGLINQDESC